jgi:hypothetical protein
MKAGWKYISIRGDPTTRGKAYGYACAKDFQEIQTMLHFLMMESYGYPWTYFIEKLNEDYHGIVRDDFPEFYEEMKGIAAGCKRGGCITSVEEILAWNLYCSIPYWFSSVSSSGSDSGSKVGKEGGGAKDHCSAFIAVGPDWTTDGGIVCAHNSFADFIDGQYANIVLDITPEKGHRILMQTSPCWIWSGTDFFVTSRGIVGTETTIGGFNAFAPKEHPIAFRIRRAMQYGNTLDDYCDMLLERNSGDYANAWLFGDTRTNEILRIELGLKFHNIERTKNGYFIGFNAPYDERIRNHEVVNSGFYDIRRHQGARLVRLGDLMDQHKGKLNLAIAQEIIADHYDVYLKKEDHPCSRTVCSHYDLDAREYMSQSDRPKPYAPHGATDGIVADSDTIKQMSFVGRYGNSCGQPFVADTFFQEHRQYAKFAPYVKDRLTQPWTTFTARKVSPKRRPSKKNTKTRKLVTA